MATEEAITRYSCKFPLNSLMLLLFNALSFSCVRTSFIIRRGLQIDFLAIYNCFLSKTSTREYPNEHRTTKITNRRLEKSSLKFEFQGTILWMPGEHPKCFVRKSDAIFCSRNTNESDCEFFGTPVSMHIAATRPKQNLP